MVTFYIARSIDEKITKVGITRDLKTRLQNLNYTDGVKFILVYESPTIHEERGIELEKSVLKEFKKDVITNEKFVSFVHMFAEGKLRTFEFANINDAIKVTLSENFRIDSYKHIPKLLFNMNRGEYYKTLSKLKGECSKDVAKESIYLPFDYNPSI